jgi:uncharacterized protein
MKWRKWNRILHRDFGYIFFFTTIIYALSGIAINHRDDWDPNYHISTEEIVVENTLARSALSKSEVKKLIKNFDPELKYRSHYFPSSDVIKVFIKDGNVTINLDSGEGLLEQTKRRPVLAPMNYLHYNPVKWWTLFSDIYAGALMFLALSGLLIPRGKKGITRRGAWLTGVGIAIPIIYLIIYFY